MSTLGSFSKKHRVAVIGSGNWGSTIAKVIAENTKTNSKLFEETITMWVHEEQVTIPKDSPHYAAGQPEKQNLSEVINHCHENVKYLPNIRLPDNVIAEPDIVKAAKDATILIFNLPHQFLRKACDSLAGNILPYARGISCIKGIEVSEKGVGLLSDLISSRLNIYCGALSGANIATEIALGKWCETTVAYDPPSQDSRHPSPSHSPTASQVNLPQIRAPGDKTKSSSDSKNLSPLPSEYPPLSHENIKKLLHRPYFHVTLTTDVIGVSLGGALKNIVALAAGFVDGLGWGDNAKAAVMRVGILEEVKFGQLFFKDRTESSTFTEQSCGVADVITSCMGGRNFRCAKKAVETGVSVQEVEKADLNGQVLQGTSTAGEVNQFLKSRGMENEFPLFTVVWDILEGKAKPEDIPAKIEPKST